jgi:hypothetical protein
MCSESFKELSDIEAHIENEHLVTSNVKIVNL